MTDQQHKLLFLDLLELQVVQLVIEDLCMFHYRSKTMLKVFINIYTG